MNWLNGKTGSKLALPTGAINQRVSAHFLEIQDIYTCEMMKKVGLEFI